MTHITKDQLQAFAQMCDQDPIWLSGFGANLKSTGLWAMLNLPTPITKVNVAPPPAPLAHDITAVQTALFDNWPGGKFVKGTPNRYGMSIEIWTAPADQIEAVKVKKMNPAFKTNVSLMTKKTLVSQIASLRKARVNPLTNLDPAYLETLEALSAKMEQSHLVGMFNTTVKTDQSQYARGVYYPAFQFVLAIIEDGTIRDAGLILTASDIATPLVLPDFDTTDYEGKRLGHKIIGQSRMDRVGFAPHWSSGS